MAQTHDAINTHFVSQSAVTAMNSVSGHIIAMHLIRFFLFVAFLDKNDPGQEVRVS